MTGRWIHPTTVEDQAFRMVQSKESNLKRVHFPIKEGGISSGGSSMVEVVLVQEMEQIKDGLGGGEDCHPGRRWQRDKNEQLESNLKFHE